MCTEACPTRLQGAALLAGGGCVFTRALALLRAVGPIGLDSHAAGSTWWLGWERVPALPSRAPPEMPSPVPVSLGNTFLRHMLCHTIASVSIQFKNLSHHDTCEHVSENMD